MRQRLLARYFSEVSRYLTDEIFASRIRQRLHEILIPALKGKERILLMSHSMGCVVAYDCLWELSHLSSHRDVREKKIESFLTMGCPLGDEAVKDHLLGSREPFARRFPIMIRSWVNLSARGDMICHDAHLRNDFRPMLRLGAVQRFEEKSRLCTVYRSRDGGWNPHKLYGYLILPEVGGIVARFLRGENLG